MATTKCELCKCLNLIAEGKKHPSQTIWQALLQKVETIRKKDPKAIASFCERHRTPLYFVTEWRSVLSFIEEVFTAVEKYLKQQENIHG